MTSLPQSIDPAILIGPPTPAGVTDVRAIMAMTLNGSVAGPTGTSGSLGNATDRALLHGLRQWSDVIVVGANTVRTENYGPVAADDAYISARSAADQLPIPRIAVLSRSLDVNVTGEFFRQATSPPLMLIPDNSLNEPSNQPHLSALRSAGAEILAVGDGTASEIVAALTAVNLRRIAIEGGPHVYSQFLEQDLIDALYITMSPQIITPLPTPAFAPPSGKETVHSHFQLASVNATDDGHVFLRYARSSTDFTAS